MSNEINKTAVEWLIEQFYNNEGMMTTKQLMKAKEMEKEQHDITWNNAILSFENEIRKVMKEGEL